MATNKDLLTNKPNTSGTKSAAESLTKKYGDPYMEARDRGDWQTMEALNRQANIERGLGNIVTSQTDINLVKSGHQSTYRPTTDEERIRAASDSYANHKAAGDWLGMSSNNMMANEIRGLGSVISSDVDIDSVRRSNPGSNRDLFDDYYYDDYGYGGGGGGGRLTPNVSINLPEFVLPPVPTLRSADDMAKHLGVRYDYDEMKKTMTDAVDKKYANLDTEFARTQDMYYDTIANNSDMLMGAMRRGDRDAMISGATSGTQAATELSAMLGMSADSSQGATELAQARGDLVTQRETEMAKTTVDALKYYNQMGLDLGQLSSSELNALVTAYASEVATLGGVYGVQTQAQIEAARMNADISMKQAEIDNSQILQRMINSGQIGVQELINAGQINLQALANEANISLEDLRAKNNKELQELIAEKNIDLQKVVNAGNLASSAASASRYAGGYGGTQSGSGTTDNVQQLSNLYALYDTATKAGNTPLAETIMKEIIKLTGIDLNADKGKGGDMVPGGGDGKGGSGSGGF